MRDKIKIISKLLVGVMIFNMIFSFNINTSYAGATEQTALDKGIVEFITNGDVTLRGGEIYYISLRGSKGGGSGSNLDSDWSYTLSNWYHLIRSGTSPGGKGTVTYYKVEPTTDVIINFAKGTAGNNGSGISYFASETFAYYSVPSVLLNGANSGGSRGSNGLSVGTLPSNGGPSTAIIAGQAGTAGGGGGGGGASLVYFGGNTTHIISAPGGNGYSAGTGITRVNYATTGMETTYRANGGSGGAGGSIPQNYNSIPNTKVTLLSSAEGTAKVIEPNENGGAIIRKEIVVGNEGISVVDIPMGSHIVLSNSVNNASTIFQKTAINFEFKYISGESHYYSATSQIALDWADFSKYGVSGSSTASSMIIKVKQDLRFVGGDGSATFPYYPEAAGSISGGSSGGGGSATDSYANTETLANSIVSVAKQIEEQLLYQKEKDVLSASKISQTVYVPFSVSLRSANSLTATKQTYFDILLNVNGRKSIGFQYNVSKNGVFNDTWAVIPTNNVIRVSALANGFNSIIVSIRDESLDTQSEIINVWKLQ